MTPAAAIWRHVFLSGVHASLLTELSTACPSGIMRPVTLPGTCQSFASSFVRTTEVFAAKRMCQTATPHLWQFPCHHLSQRLRRARCEPHVFDARLRMAEPSATMHRYTSRHAASQFADVQHSCRSLARGHFATASTCQASREACRSLLAHPTKVCTEQLKRQSGYSGQLATSLPH